MGRLRAWVAEHEGPLRHLAGDGWVLYGEWLWITHGTAYDALPDWLVVLDCWHEGAGFVGVDARDQRVTPVGLQVPPRQFEGVLSSERVLRQLLGPSAYSRSGTAEGLVLRAADGARCKVVDPNYPRIIDDEWDGRQHNLLASAGQRPTR